MTRSRQVRAKALAGFVATFLASLPVCAETLRDRYQAGAEAFEAGRYDEAARIFRDLRERYRVLSPDLLVNLGAAEYMAGRPGLALLHFHEAMRAAPGTRAAETARVNAERVRAALNDRGGVAGTGYVFGPYHDAWTALFAWLPPRGTLLVFLLFWSILFLSLTAWRVLRSRAPRLLGGLVLIGLAGAMVSGVFAYGAARAASYEIAVVIEDGAPLYDRADALEPRMTLPEALEARVVERRGTLIRLRLSSGEEGWVPDRMLGIPGITTP